MKVLQINVLGKTTSIGRTTRELHESLERRGIESYIATARNEDCDDAYKISSLNAMHVDTLLTMISGLEGYHSKIQTYRLIKYIKKVKPDIVHLRNLHNVYINLGMLLKYLGKSNIATVITLHDLWFLTGKCCYYHTFPCDKWINGCRECPAIPLEYHRPFFDRTNKMWKDKKKWLSGINKLAIIGVSKWTMHEALKSYVSNAAIIDYIYNWIDLSVFYPRDNETCKEKYGLKDKKVILAVSTFWSENGRKGFEDYLELAKVLPSEYQIVLVGKHNYQISLPTNITALPPTNNVSELAEIYSSANIYLNLSRGETFGKVSAEAIACGTPVIALDNTANPEIVPEGAGMIIKSAATDEVLKAINEIMKKPREYYCDICREYAMKYFEKERNIDKYIEVYNQLLRR